MELKVSSCVLFILLTLHAPRVRGVVHMQRIPTCLGWGAPRARVQIWPMPPAEPRYVWVDPHSL